MPSSPIPEGPGPLINPGWDLNNESFDNAGDWANYISDLLAELLGSFYETGQDTDDIDRIYRQEEAQAWMDLLDEIANGNAGIDELNNFDDEFLSDIPEWNEYEQSVKDSYIAESEAKEDAETEPEEKEKDDAEAQEKEDAEVAEKEDAEIAEKEDAEIADKEDAEAQEKEDAEAQEKEDAEVLDKEDAEVTQKEEEAE